MVPINVDNHKMEVLPGTFGCNIGSMPFTYLGLPMGTNKQKIVDFAPLIDRIERRLPSTSVFLSHGQRLIMVNLVLSALPTYYMCTLKLPKKVIQHMIELVDTASGESQVTQMQQYNLWQHGNWLVSRKTRVD